MSETKLTKKEILEENAAIRITLSILFSTIREMIHSHMDDAKMKDKQEVNALKKYLSKLYKDFDQNRHDDNPYHEGLVERFQDHAEQLMADNSYQSRRDVFAAFVVLADFVSKNALGLTIGVDKYITYKFHMCIRKSARYFANTATDNQKRFTEELYEHYIARKNEAKELINIPEDAVSEL